MEILAEIVRIGYLSRAVCSLSDALSLAYLGMGKCGKVGDALDEAREALEAKEKALGMRLDEFALAHNTKANILVQLQR